MGKHELHQYVQKAMTGDRAAFEAVYRLKAKVIASHVVRLVYNPAAVEDAVQEVVMRMYRRIGQLRSPEAFNVWMYRIILNTCHTINAQNAAHPCVSLDEINEAPSEIEAAHQPAGAAELGERNLFISRAIDSLPERQRLALTMYFYDGMSYREIAQVLDITVSGVARNIMNAKQSLKERLAATGKKRTAGDFLFGVIMAPAIRGALEAGMDKALSPQLAQALTESPLRALAADKMGARAANAGLSPGGTAQFAAVTVCAVVAGVSIMAATLPDMRQAAQPISAVIEMAPAVPGTHDHINPDAIRIEVLDSGGQVAAWYIEDAGGTRLYTGQSSEIEDELALLAPGRYTAVWLLKDAAGRRTWARRSFEIR